VGRTELFFSKSATLAAHCLIVPAILVGVGLVAGYRASRFAPLAGAGSVPVSVGHSIAHVWSGAGLVA
jgi:hypothetical protein